MMFLNVFMLLGAAAASVPLIIHLLNRGKFKVVDWGAMHLLEAVIEENNRRIQILELLLLLIRCLIPIVLALCLARPLVNWFAVGSADGSTSTIVIFDDSLSMARRHSDGFTHFQKAKADLDSLSKRLADSGSFRVMTAQANSSPLKQPLAGDFAILSALESALNLAAKNRNETHEILVISDFQASNLEGFRDERIARLVDRLDALPKPPSISFLNLSLDALPSRNNVRVSRLEIDTERVLADQPFLIRVEIRNEGANDLEGVQLELLENGVVVAERTIQLPPDGTRQMEFSHVITDADLRNRSEITSQAFNPSLGLSHAISAARSMGEKQNAEVISERFLHGNDKSTDVLLAVRLGTSDDNPADNIINTVVHRVQPVRVAVVSGRERESLADNTTERQQDDGAFLSAALSPFAFSGTESTEKDAISVVRIDATELAQEDLSKLDILTLIDPSRLNDEILQRITQFVTDGGGLLVYAGPKLHADLDWINQNLGTAGARWFDFQLTALASPGETPGPHSRVTRLQMGRFEHPTMTFFNGEDNSNFAIAEFSNWLIADGIGQKSKLIASFETGHPMAIETNLGNGKTILCTTSADTTWNNLPLRPVYLPIMQRWVDYLKHSSHPLGSSVAGRPATVVIDVSDNSDFEPVDVIVQSPDGRELDFTVDLPARSESHDQVQVTWNDTSAVGAYRVTSKLGNERFYVAAANESEWESLPVDQRELSEIADRINAAVPATIEEYFQMRAERAVGFEVWKWVWWCVLGLLVAERLVVWILTRGA